MAGLNAIQILRGTSSKLNSSTQTLLPGQLVYNKDKNYLAIGSDIKDGDSSPLNKSPIEVRRLVAYYEDTDNSIGANTTPIFSIGDSSLGGSGHNLTLEYRSTESDAPDNYVALNDSTFFTNVKNVTICASNVIKLDSQNANINSTNVIIATNLSQNTSKLNITNGEIAQLNAYTTISDTAQNITSISAYSNGEAIINSDKIQVLGNVLASEDNSIASITKYHQIQLATSNHSTEEQQNVIELISLDSPTVQVVTDNALFYFNRSENVEESWNNISGQVYVATDRDISKINGVSQNSSTTIYAPTSSGSYGQIAAVNSNGEYTYSSYFEYYTYYIYMSREDASLGYNISFFVSTVASNTFRYDFNYDKNAYADSSGEIDEEGAARAANELIDNLADLIGLMVEHEEYDPDTGRLNTTIAHAKIPCSGITSSHGSVYGVSANHTDPSGTYYRGIDIHSISADGTTGSILFVDKNLNLPDLIVAKRYENMSCIFSLDEPSR